MDDETGAEITQIYIVGTGDEDIYNYSGLLEPRTSQWWFTPDIISTADFELATHNLAVLDSRERDVPSERLHDLDLVDSGVLAVSERGWPLLPALVETGCRLAEHVKVTGDKKFKLVFPTATLDILDHDASHLTINPVAGSISAVKNTTIYDEDVPLPLLFRVLLRGPKESYPSIRIYASQTFVDACKALDLTGADFYPVKRSKRPA